MMELLPIERMLLDELLRQQQEAMAAIDAKIGAAVTAIAERVGIPAVACEVNAQTGEIRDTREAPSAAYTP